MKKTICASLLVLSISLIVVITFAQDSQPTQANSFKVRFETPLHGNIKVTPAIPQDSIVPKGTVLTIDASPANGYAIDAVYFYNAEGRGKRYFESMTQQLKVTVDGPKAIGASFIDKNSLKGFKVVQDVVYAQPGVKKLKYDVYTPDGAKNLPCIVIIHGGGWTSNTEDIMRGLARELVKTGKYVVFSIDYRWLGKGDGDAEANTMSDLIEDVYGALAHIQEHARSYGGDPERIAVTGDSAGGHLSAVAATLVTHLGENGFGTKPGVYEYKPTYLPKGKSVAVFKKDITRAIKVAAPSYGIFGGEMLRRFVADLPHPDLVLAAVSPLDNVQNVKDRAVPNFLTRGTKDGLVKNETVQVYADALQAAGQKVEYLQVEGAGHAFFDWKPDDGTKATFAQYGVPYAAKMLAFFDDVFYPGKRL